MPSFQSPSVEAGMAPQMATRRSRIAGGERPIGWKLGFGTPAALAKFDLSGPLVGYMMEASVLPSGATADIAGWVKPVAEPEIAVRIAEDIADGSALSAASIAAFAPAIELADMSFAPEDVEKILADNIFHRHVVLGPFQDVGAGHDWSALRGTVWRGGNPVASVDDVEANTGKFLAILRTCADTLAAAGEQLRRGDLVILGSLVPPLFLTAEDTSVGCELAGLGRSEIKLRGL